MNVNNFSGIKAILFDNVTVKQTIFKNTFWLAIGSGVNKLLMLVLLIYAARILGAVEYGKFSFAFAFISLFVVFHDFGLSTTIIREYAKKQEQKGKEEFYSIISLKVFLSITAFILILIGSFFITADPSIRNIILILTFFSLFNSFIAIFYAVFQARQKMEYQTWLEMFQYLLISGLGIFILFNFPSAANLSYGYLIAGLISLISVLIFFSIKIFNLRIFWQRSVWRKYLRMSWPLALTSLFGFLYSYIDSVMMGYWGMIAQTGWYNAAYRIIFVALIPMGLISGSFYPVLSKFFKESKEKLQKIWDFQLQLMILFSLPLVVGGIVLAPRIIHSFYPSDFSPSILTFQILIVMAGLIFLYRPFFDVMIASNQQKKTFWITLLGSLANISLNLFLIPEYGLYGAALATVATCMLTLLIGIWLTIKSTSIRIPCLKLFYSFVLASLSSILMCFVIAKPIIYNLNIFLSVPIGALSYCFCLFSMYRITKPIYEKI
ncbi:flippase [Candidatus Parcubacteria bacterium]|nr:flippase [Candidatus Parcubacteria bacterium]